VTTDFGQELEIMQFLRCAKKNDENGCKCIPIVKIFYFYGAYQNRIKTAEMVQTL